MRTGVLGGSFDPIHRGHLGVARAVADALGLDRVLLMPAAQAPLRAAGVRANGEQRAEMVRSALAELGDARLELSELELRRGGVSYTVDTLRALHAEHAQDEFTWIIGEDQLERLAQWKDPVELAQLADWAVYARPGYPGKAVPAVPGLRVRRVETGPLWAVSSTEIRARLAAGDDVTVFLSDKVIEYIRKHRLYGAQ